MSYEYSAVARGDMILAQHATSSGNFDVIICDILRRMNPKENHITTERSSNKFYILHNESNLNFVVAGPVTLQASEAFEFLTKVERLFIMKFSRVWKEAAPYGLHTEFSPSLKSLMQTPQDDKIQTIKSNMEETQSTMVNVLEHVTTRQTKLEDMEKSVLLLSDSANEYERSAKDINRKYCWQKYRLVLLIILILICIILIILFIACKGITLPNCRGKSE